MSLIHDQLRARRKQLQLRQNEMPLRMGMSRQQYNRLENGGNSSLKILELAAAGLDLTLMLIPKEKFSAVTDALTKSASEPEVSFRTPPEYPWTELLAENDE
jgi:transcriptional regulator with XRE-family HTH domain